MHVDMYICHSIEVTEHKEPISSVTEIITDHESKSPTQKEPPPTHKEVTKMNAQQSTVEITRLFLDLLAQYVIKLWLPW